MFILIVFHFWHYVVCKQRFSIIFFSSLWSWTMSTYLSVLVWLAVPVVMVGLGGKLGCGEGMIIILIL